MANSENGREKERVLLAEECAHKECCPVQMVHDRLLADDEIMDMTVMFKMLADPTRLKIINALMISEMCVQDLTAALDMTQSAVSHQLAALRNTRLISYRREGKQVYYSLDDEHIGLLFNQCLIHARESDD